MATPAPRGQRVTPFSHRRQRGRRPSPASPRHPCRRMWLADFTPFKPRKKNPTPDRSHLQPCGFHTRRPCRSEASRERSPCPGPDREGRARAHGGERAGAGDTRVWGRNRDVKRPRSRFDEHLHGPLNRRPGKEHPARTAGAGQGYEGGVSSRSPRATADREGRGNRNTSRGREGDTPARRVHGPAHPSTRAEPRAQEPEPRPAPAVVARRPLAAPGGTRRPQPPAPAGMGQEAPPDHVTRPDHSSAGGGGDGGGNAVPSIRDRSGARGPCHPRGLEQPEGGAVVGPAGALKGGSGAVEGKWREWR